MTKPRSINIFFLDGDPNGIRVARIMLSTIQAFAFRRNKLAEVLKTFFVIEQQIEPPMVSEPTVKKSRVIFLAPVVACAICKLDLISGREVRVCDRLLAMIGDHGQPLRMEFR